MADEGLFYTQTIDFEPVELVDEVSDTESFDEYLWMDNEEEFEKYEMQRLVDQALIEECMEAMMEEEQEVLEHLRLDRESLNNSISFNTTTSSSGFSERDEEEEAEDDSNNDHLAAVECLSTSTLNPLASEFIPAN